MNLSRLTEYGLQQFSGYLDQLRETPTLAPPMDLLDNPQASAVVEPRITVAAQDFPSRFEAAQYLDQLLLSAELPHADRDVGLWAWLTLFWFDQVCPVRKDRTRKVAVNLSYVPQFISQRYYRHYLLGPWSILQAHRDEPDRVIALLSNRMDVATSEIFRLFVENPSLLISRCAVGIASHLYYDEKAGKLKRGASQKTGTGHCRRLIAYLQQIDLTYDLQILTEERLLSMLPTEFKKFRISSGQLPI